MANELLVNRGLPRCACGGFHYSRVHQASQGEHLLCLDCHKELWPIGVTRIGNENVYVYPLPERVLTPSEPLSPHSPRHVKEVP